MSQLREEAAREFWAHQPSSRELKGWSDKYEALVALPRLEPERRSARMRWIASRWPSALREAELVAPTRLEARGLRIRDLARDTSLRSREELALEGHADWLLAGELNYKLLELAQMRRQAKHQGREWDYALAWSALSPPRAPVWPAPDSGVELLGLPAGVRLAYLALAWLSGLSLPAVNSCVFDRRGHWDRREGDPQWAHRPGPMELALELGSDVSAGEVR